MQAIQDITKRAERPIKAIQFGEGNFLRAFIDWQIDILNARTTGKSHPFVDVSTRMQISTTISSRQTILTSASYSQTQQKQVSHMIQA